MRRFYRGFKNIGITETLDFSERLRIELSNLFILISLHALVLHVLYNALGPNELLAYLVPLTWLVIAIITISLNHWHYYFAARLFLVLITLIITVALHLLNGWLIRLEPMYMLLIVSSAFFFRPAAAISVAATILIAYSFVAYTLRDFIPPWSARIVPTAPLTYFFFASLSAFALIGSVLLQSYRFQKRLRQQNMLLQKKNDEFERFNAILAHDLRTPVRHINSFTHLLAAKIKAGQFDAAEEQLQYLREGAHKLNNILNDIALYFSIASPENDHLETIHLPSLLAQIEAQITDDFPDRKFSITIHGETTLRSKVEYIRLLLSQLLNNALLYNEQEIAEIDISVANTSKKTQISVKDNGIGIPKAYHEYIFEHFRRVEPTYAPNNSGLGLSICQKIVVALGGEISMESQPGQGSTFVMKLPKVRS